MRLKSLLASLIASLFLLGIVSTGVAAPDKDKKETHKKTSKPEKADVKAKGSKMHEMMVKPHKLATHGSKKTTKAKKTTKKTKEKKASDKMEHK